ncbi:unnamed protein product [Miscanthus lutarioriparius]|uniref:Pectinesterase n=1 Tax=Miscanthus lutarioriparius TaxID=422564 RepID=A0A811PWX2_9POAL|nr:unnamed protein product [Miscanthus lutarioriparius]
MDHHHHLLARHLGAPPLLVILSCLALILAGCRCSSSAHAAPPSPVFAFPAAAVAKAHAVARHHERLRVTLDAAATRVGEALGALAAVTVTPAASSSSSPLATVAREDCVELLDEALQLLAGARAAPRADRGDALTWLSAALTNHDTCADSLAEDRRASPRAPCRRPRRGPRQPRHEAGGAAGLVRSSCKNETARRQGPCGFPRWLPARDRRLLLAPAVSLAGSADIVVAKDGTGTHATIADAVKAAPECSERWTVIHVKAGRYDENVNVGMKKTNLVFVGDGKGVTVVAGNRSVADNYTTFRTATFAASGFGFMMRDMTVENRAGPARQQAVALRVSADRAVVHRCSIAGYQDTLYAHSNRQFYRDCDVYGTVDFVFGNAAAVLQRCNLWARVPLPGQKNTVTAQSRNESCQLTGIVLHACRLLAGPALEGPTAATASPAPSPAPDLLLAPPTYLGRPWKPFSRVVVMLSYIGPHVPPQGWLEWNATGTPDALDRLYFGEYMNYGPGAGVAGRVPWPGHRVINSTAEAERFTVARFIDGASWLPATGVSFVAGLSLL